MDLHEIGAMLREERERQGLSIEAVSDKIKITCSCLTAIEEGNESHLPHPVYAKGFIKNYAKLLGVDQEDFSKHLSEVYRPEEPFLNDGPILQGVQTGEDVCPVRPSSKFPLPAMLIVGVLTLLLVGLGWYYYAHFLHPSDAGPETKPVPEATAEPAPQAESDRPIPTVPRAAPTTQPAGDASTPAPQAPTASAPSQAPSAEDQATQDIATSGPAAGASPAAVPPASEPAAGAPATPTLTVGENGPHTVTITAKSRCWVQAGADGGSMQERTLEKGDVFVGRFADNLIVRLGNAGAVDIRFDNKLYPLQASKGSVKTLKFVAKKSEGETAAKTPPKAETPVPAAPATDAQAAATTGEAAAAVAKEVEIYGQDGSWLIINPDKGPAKEIYVKKGQKLTVPFDEKVEIRLGNPSSVVFRYGGKDMPVVTGKGETKTVRFP